MKKMVAFVLAVMMLTAMLIGCTGQKENTPEAVSTNTVSTQAVETTPEPQKPEEVKIVWYWNNGGVQLPEDSYIVKKVKEDLNITYVHAKPASTEYEETLNLMLASGEQLDVINCDGTLKQRLIKDGVLQPIDDYLNDKYVGNLIRISNQWEKAMELVKYSDGKRYTVPVTNNMSRAGDYYIRMDWLKNLGLQVPSTMDELKDVLVQFTKNDPDQNGKDDTWGTAASEIWGAYSFATNLGCQYGNYYKTDDGNVTYFMFHPRVKEWIRYVKSLLDSKAMDPEILTLKYEQVIDMIKAGKVGFYAGYNQASDKDVEEIKKVHSAAEYEPMPAPKGIYDEGYYDANSVLREETAVSTKCNDVEAVFRLINYFADDKSTADNLDFTGTYFPARYGQQGVNWDVKDGLLDNSSQKFADQNKIDIWAGGKAGRFRSRYDMSWIKLLPQREQNNINKIINYKNIYNIPASHPASPISGEGIMLPDEAAALQDEFSAKFDIYFANAALGKVDIDKGFDDFMAEADKAGYKDYVAAVTQIMKENGRLK